MIHENTLEAYLRLKASGKMSILRQRCMDVIISTGVPMTFHQVTDAITNTFARNLNAQPTLNWLVKVGWLYSPGSVLNPHTNSKNMTYYLPETITMPEIQISQIDPNATSVAQAREWLAEASRETKESKGAECPCCATQITTKAVRIPAAQAAALVLLHSQYPEGTVVNIPAYLEACESEELKKAFGKFSRIALWDLVEATNNPDQFTLCQFGKMFVDGVMPITEKAWVRRSDGVCVGFDGKVLTVDKVLGKRFNLESLKAGALP